MSPQHLHDLGSALEAAAHMSPDKPIKVDPLEIARALMWAAAQLRDERQ